MERLWGRLASIVSLGRITATTALQGKGVRRAQLRIDDAEARDDTPLLGLYGVASRPRPGADAVMLFLAGDRSRGLIIATNDARYQIELSEGEVALHDDTGQRVHLTRDGIVINGAGRPIRILADVEVVGSIRSTGDQVAGTVSQMSHLHREVQPGSGQSGPPVP